MVQIIFNCGSCSVPPLPPSKGQERKRHCHHQANSIPVPGHPSDETSVCPVAAIPWQMGWAVECGRAQGGGGKEGPGNAENVTFRRRIILNHVWCADSIMIIIRTSDVT